MGRRINLVVVSPLRERVDFTFSDDMPLRKLMQAYADYFDIDIRTLCFRIRGLMITGFDTAFLLNIKPGDIIEVTDSP